MNDKKIIVALDNINLYDSKYLVDEIKNQDVNRLKILLANEATTMLHGKEAASKAEKTAKNTFEKGAIGDDLPFLKIKKEELENGINVIDIVVNSKLLSSKSEVRRAIKNKGIKINNQTVENEQLNISLKDFENENFLKLSTNFLFKSFIMKSKHLFIAQLKAYGVALP